MPKKHSNASFYFDLQASWGLTKHMGGYGATRELAGACHLDNGSYVLDVGSGVGISACYFAEEYGCRVVGVDISEKMVKKARKRAKRKKVSDKTDFKLGDAQNLPFKDGVFDAVICESVLAFIENKQEAVSEFARVVKTGGYVGMNEVTWVEEPPPELAIYMYRAMGQVEFLNPEKGRDLLEKTGLKEIEVRVYKTSAWHQWLSEIKQMDPRDYLIAWAKFFLLLFKNPEVRKWVRDISFPPKSIFRIFNYLGYALYVGKK